MPVFCMGASKMLFFLDSGSRKCLFCIGGFENAISLYTGKKCIWGQILAYFGDFCILQILLLRVDLQYLVGVDWTGLGPGRCHRLDRAL